MDILKISTEELRKLAPVDLNSVEKEAKKALAELRIDIYNNSAAGNKHKLRKTLARVQTIRGEWRRQGESKSAANQQQQ